MKYIKIEVIKDFIESLADNNIMVCTDDKHNKLTIIDKNKTFRNKVLPKLIISDLDLKIELSKNYYVELETKEEQIMKFYDKLNEIKYSIMKEGIKNEH